MVLTKALRSSQLNNLVHHHKPVRTICLSAPVITNHKNETTKLSQLFSDKTETRQIKRNDNRVVYKELSPTCLRNVYGHNFLRHAAEEFGCKNQEIAKWLSGSELKKVAIFGCPSLSKKAVFSAKILRTFFKIQENMVCSKCVLKQSCKYANQNVWNSNTKNLYLPAVMNVISHYALDSVHPQLIVSDEIKTVVTRLLKVVVKLSQTVS
ncbi:Dysferlin [Heracleum sosnowskyi]|uniref:Dysferlin n=1 Tax=Heracleum sosnowskyi TaxID=360622 RepID=A0AAD8GME9_9APIA|nr:Dysferlin [Heracleum sosnowskyi]